MTTTALDHLTGQAWLDGQGWLQVGELALAFALSSLIGFERQLRHKSAGLRTQAIVGTASALMLIVSKYGFTDVLVQGAIVLDPSRVAAQIVSGVGFLGAGLILTRRGAVRGLTTAAAVWETAAIGMAAGAGLWLLAIVATALYFVAVFGYTALLRVLPGRERSVELEVVYLDGRGVLRELIAAATSRTWRVLRLVPSEGTSDGLVSVAVQVEGTGDVDGLVEGLGSVDGVRAVRLAAEEE